MISVTIMCTDVCVRMSPVPPIQYQKSDFVLILCLVAGVSIPCQDQFQSPKGFFLTLIINYLFDWNKYCFLKQRRFRGVEKVLENGPPFDWHTLPSDFICHSHVWNKWSLKTKDFLLHLNVLFTIWSVIKLYIYEYYQIVFLWNYVITFSQPAVTHMLINIFWKLFQVKKPF